MNAIDESVEVVQTAVDVTSEVPDTERKLVAKLSKQVADARKADKVFRARVVRDRAVVDGRALEGFEVSAQLVAAIIDTLIPFIYAKDPDVDVVPEDQTAPPYKPRLQAPQPPRPPVDPATGQPIMAPDGVPVSPDPMAVQQFASELAAYNEALQAEHKQAEQERIHNDFVRRLGQTIEIVVSRLWRKAKLKAEAMSMVRAGLTTGEGWLKVSLHGDLKTDPTVQRELYQLQQQHQAIANLQEEIREGNVQNPDPEMARLQAMIEGAQARLETYVGRCLVVDWVDTLDMQWPSTSRKITEYVRAPWGADCTYLSKEDAASRFGIDLSRLASATCWREPDQGQWVPGTGAEDDLYQNPGDGEYWVKTVADDERGMLRVWELHSKQEGTVYTWIDGCDFWAKPPMPPRLQTSRFYPYFLWAPYECDGSRHPQSLAGRLAKLQAEYASTRSNELEVKRRSKPGVLVDGTNIDDVQMDKINSSTNQEMTVVKPLRPGEPLTNSFAPKPYARVDPALYDTTKARTDMETVSGAQEALTQGVNVAKTATEAEIQQTGSQARTGYSRDVLDMMLGELAEYTAELALGGFERDQVLQWAGPHAVWPNTADKDALSSLVYVAVRAGSSGKPNTSAERQAWSTIMPMLQGLMMQIGQMNGADPQEMADKLQELLRETVARVGDRLDIDRFLPMPSPMAQMGQIPGAMGGPLPPPGAQAPGPQPSPTPPMS